MCDGRGLQSEPVRFVLLGEVDPSRPAFGLDLAGSRPRAILELLLLDAGRSVSVDSIIDQLWPEDPPKTARNSVQRFVADIRRALGDDRDRLETTANGYRLRLEPGELDLHDVERLRDEAERLDDPEQAAAVLGQALEHFGRLDDVDGSTARATAARLEHRELRLQLLEARVDADLACGRAAASVDELRRLTTDHPYHEGFVGQLMRALAASGRRVEALRAFAELRRTLASDIGIDPSASLQRLEQELLDGDDTDAPVVPAAPLPTPAVTPRRARSVPNLLPPTPSLVGRDGAIDRLGGLLGEHRLVTVLGPGGIGKTTLAMAVARRHSGEPDGLVVARLAEIERADQLPDVIAEALSFQPEGNTPEVVAEEVVDVLARSAPLLVLDNAEHLVDATAEFAAHVLAHSACRIVVTSRERLGLPEEWVLPLERLSVPSDVPGEVSDSEVLLRRLAGASGVELTETAEIHAVCEALDGLPLAIELAAAQLEHLGIADLAQRLDSLLDMTARRAAEDRHSSLNALIQWSWDLLDADETRLIGQLATFRSRVDATTIEAIAGPAGLAVLGGVVSKSLVTRTLDEGRAWFSLPFSVRLFALRDAEAEGRLAELRDDHADHLLGYLRQWSVSEMNAWHDAIEGVARHRLEYDIALDWLDQAGRHEDLVEMASRVTGMWGRRGPGAELEKWSRRVYELSADLDLDREATAAVLVLLVEARFRFADYGRMAKYGERLVEHESAGPTDLGTPLIGFYGTAIHTFSLDPLSRSRVEDAAERAPGTATADLNVAQTRMWLGCCQLMNREFDAAIDSFHAVLERTRRPGGTVLWAELGHVAALHLLGREDDAYAALATVTSRPEDSIWNYAVDIVDAIVHASVGELDAARETLTTAAQRRILERRAASRDDFQIGFGLVAAHAGDEELVDRLLAEPMGQSPIIASLLLNHLHPGEHDDDGWRRIWSGEYEARLLSAMQRFSGELASVADELARWSPSTS